MADPADSGIYEIVNLVNGKRYIGSAKNLTIRWAGHRNKLRKRAHANRYLQASWIKYGEYAFEFRVLERCAVSMLIECEQRAIDGYKPEYNLSPTAGSTLGVRFTDEAKKNISAALKGKLLGRKRDRAAVEKGAAKNRGRECQKETREKISAALTGLKRPERSVETRAKLSAALKGKKKSPEHMAALQAGRARQVFNEDRRTRVSEALKAAYEKGARSRERPPEYREKIAASLRGRKATEEQRANQSAAQTGKKRGPYRLDPGKAEARRQAGMKLAALVNARRPPLAD